MRDNWDRYFDQHYACTAPRTQPPEVAEEEAEASMRLSDCIPPSVVLDMPCGYGRHSALLAKVGYRVVGMDRSAPLLEEARKRGMGSSLWLARADYRAIPSVADAFDVVLNLFTSFGFYDEEVNLKVLREFRRVLKPGGRLVLEIQHRDALVRDFQAHDWLEVPQVGTLVIDRIFDPVEGVIRATQALLQEGGHANSQSYTLRVYTATELVQLVRQAGFAEVKCFGSLQGEPLSPDSRLVLLAQ